MFKKLIEDRIEEIFKIKKNKNFEKVFREIDEALKEINEDCKPLNIEFLVPHSYDDYKEDTSFFLLVRNIKNPLNFAVIYTFYLDSNTGYPYSLAGCCTIRTKEDFKINMKRFLEQERTIRLIKLVKDSPYNSNVSTKGYFYEAIDLSFL